MLGKRRNQIEMTCPNCNRVIIIYELNDGSPCRSYECALCPNCHTKIHEDYIVGEFDAVLKNIDENNDSRFTELFQK